jgi:hypothetical protein
MIQSAWISSHSVPGGNLWVSLLDLDADLSCLLACASASLNAALASAIIADLIVDSSVRDAEKSTGLLKTNLHSE